MSNAVAGYPGAVSAEVSVLDEIVAGVREDVTARMAQTPLAELQARAAALPAPRDVFALLSGAGISVIAEVKRHSPSKGALADIPDPAELAALYAAGGASVVSVLTEARRFKGSLADLDAVRAAVDIAVLRKDFMIGEYQMWEARAHGADLVLLIVAALTQEELTHLHAFARELGLSVLVEVHDASEVQRAIDAGANIIGVNARNLKTLAVGPEAFAQVAPLIPDTCVKVAESGIAGTEDVRRYASLGANAVLVGEALVKESDPSGAVAAFIAAGSFAEAVR